LCIYIICKSKTRMTIPDYIGKYKVISKLDEGGYSTVYKVSYKSRVYAAKVANEDSPESSVKAEMSTYKAFRHPNMPTLIDRVKYKSHYVLIIPLYDSILLDIIIQRQYITKDFISKFLLQMGSVLYYLHYNGIQHTDIKGSNIMVSNVGTPDLKFTLIDFNVSRFGKAVDAYTPIEMKSPELIIYKKVDQVDMWQLGIELYEILARRHFVTNVNKVNAIPMIGKKLDWKDGSIFKNRDNYYKYFRTDGTMKQRRINTYELNAATSIYKDPALKPFSEYIPLLRRLLDINPETRMTAAQLLNHPLVNPNSNPVPIPETVLYFRGNYIRDYKLNRELHLDAFRNMSTYRASRTTELISLPKTNKLEDRLRVLQKLEHPNLNRMIEFFNYKKNRVAVVMPVRYRDRDLHEEIEQIYDDYNELYESVISKLIRDIVRAVVYLKEHKIVPGLFHLNDILVSGRIPKRVSYKLSIEASLAVSPTTQLDGYVSPEELFNSTRGDASVVWNIGMIIYHTFEYMPDYETPEEIVRFIRNLKGVHSLDIYTASKKFKYTKPKDLLNSYMTGQSKDFKDIMNRMLETDRKRRITAEEILKHPFINPSSSSKLDIESFDF